MNDPTIYEGECLSFHATTDQARRFVDELDARGRLDFAVAAAILDTSLQSGRPPAGRAERVRGSRCGLFELRVTPPGRKGPHVRLLYLPVGRRMLVVRGLIKRQARLPRGDIDIADRAAGALLGASGD